MARRITKSAKRSVEDRLIAGLTEFRAAVAGDKQTAARFTVRSLGLMLEPGDYDGPAVQTTRDLLGVSQAIFARFLGVSVDAVQSWEQGLRTPSGTARRFMDEIQRNPDFWRSRLSEATQEKPAA